ncbi:hypothetical protein ACFWNL_23590 [Kitasatospora sp. NPDC058397]|uniref:hypothetical protein n=1 Tax=unclassified Kitasatospora TaxID=2633591 RepID=UPI003646C174
MDFASRLRPLFDSLRVSYRVYGKRRNITASAICRYLSGERIPTQRFLEDLFDDLAAAGARVDDEEQATLLHLRQRALNGGGPVQQTQAQLEEAQQEVRDCLARESELQGALQAREQELRENQEQLDRLRRERGSSDQAAQLAWQLSQYERVEAERDRLRDEVDELREELFGERDWRLRLTEQCRQLMWQLLVTERVPAAGGLVSLLSNAESASVSELVGLAAAADDRQLAVATELIRSAGRHRPLGDAVDLFVALHEAGRPQQAQATLPASVLGRTVSDVTELIGAFAARGLDDYTATVIRTWVELQSWPEVVELTVQLHKAGEDPEPGDTVAMAAAAVRSPDDVISLLLELNLRHGLSSTVGRCLDVMAKEREIAALVEVADGLEDAGLPELCRRLVVLVVQQRRPQDTAELLRQLSQGRLIWLADQMFDELNRYGRPRTIVAVLSGLGFADGAARIQAAAEYAAEFRSGTDAAALVRGFQAVDLSAHAALITGNFVLLRAPAEVTQLMRALDTPGGESAGRCLEEAERRMTVDQILRMGRKLFATDLREHGCDLLARTTRSRPAGVAAELLAKLSEFPDIAEPVFARTVWGLSLQAVAEVIVSLRSRPRLDVADRLAKVTEELIPDSREALREEIEAAQERRAANLRRMGAGDIFQRQPIDAVQERRYASAGKEWPEPVPTSKPARRSRGRHALHRAKPKEQEMRDESVADLRRTVERLAADLAEARERLAVETVRRRAAEGGHCQCQAV